MTNWQSELIMPPEAAARADWHAEAVRVLQTIADPPPIVAELIAHHAAQLEMWRSVPEWTLPPAPPVIWYTPRFPGMRLRVSPDLSGKAVGGLAWRQAHAVDTHHTADGIVWGRLVETGLWVAIKAEDDSKIYLREVA